MLSFSTHILFGLRPDSSNTPWSALVIVIPFLSFEGTTHANLLKISITHNKKQTLLLHLLMNPTQDGLFRCCSPMCGGGGGGGKKDPLSLKSVTHIPKWWNLTLYSYTLPKEDPKDIWITWYTPWVLLTTTFFHRKSANFAISRIQI